MNPVRPRVALTVAAVALLALAWWLYPRKREVPQPPAAVAGERLPAPPAYETVSHTVKPGQTAGEVLRILDAGAAEALLNAADGRLDRVSVGDTFHIDRRPGPKGPTLWRLRLAHGDEEVLHLERGPAGWHAERLPIPYTVQEGVQTVVVADGSSLWGAAQTYGLEEAQIGALAVIYEYDVDFNTEIQPGAVIRAVTERLIADDGTSRFGDIRAAEFVNGGKTYTAIRFTDKDGRVGWFAPDGKGRRKKFLRSPLAFSRVTSGFTMARWHPVLKTARPHFGTDFGCPVGTPVRAVSDGVATAAGYHGGHGNYVELKHDGPYTTSYSHLSKILVKRGQKVRQGDTIGHSGNTGLSTGPHLHYQFMRNGTFVNPMTVELPMSGGPDTIDMEAFGKVRDAVMPMLEAARAAPPTPVSGATTSAAAAPAPPTPAPPIPAPPAPAPAPP
jgi:murein DD-endopeptidase MepM/ murein hydrolase activator NlpD